MKFKNKTSGDRIGDETSRAERKSNFAVEDTKGDKEVVKRSKKDKKREKKEKKEQEQQVAVEVEVKETKKDKKDKKEKKEKNKKKKEKKGEVEPVAAQEKKTIMEVALKPSDMLQGNVTDSKAIEEFRKQHDMTVSGDGVENLGYISTFNFPAFPKYVVEKLSSKGFKAPTPIQAQCWPIALAGRDLIGLAETGSGKTLSFVLPAIVHILDTIKAQPAKKGSPLVLVLAPTRELAIQIQTVSAEFDNGSILSTCIYGGVPKHAQIKELKKGPSVIIATPGRLIDLMEEGEVKLDDIAYLVLDEADRMLDMGFEPQIRAILSRMKKSAQRQTLMFSATWPNEIQKLANEFFNNPIKVNIGSQELSANHKVAQHVEVCEEWEKRKKLDNLLAKIFTKDEKILIFMLYKKSCDRVFAQLQNAGWPIACIHGDKRQDQRERTIAEFKSGKFPILMATDVAARGLDIHDVKYVINYEFPLVIEDYVHRIGRTGRAGQTGTSYTYFTPENKEFSQELYKILTEANQKIPAKLEEWKHIGKRTQKKTGLTAMYGTGNWEASKTMPTKTHFKFDD